MNQLRSHLIPAAAALVAALTAGTAFAGHVIIREDPKAAPPIEQTDWRKNTISPVTNPIFFEDAQINSEIRPIFMHHEIDNTFLTGGGDVRVYAVQLRWAITERLAFIATKDGYIDADYSSVLVDHEGWADVAAGFKYAIIDDRENQFILTPGIRFEFPLGNQRVWQGNGLGEWDFFVSAEKGFDKLHLLGSVGFRCPNDWSEETAQFHFSAHIDYWVCRWFIPFVECNGYTVVNSGDKIPLDTEGYDLINFGSSKAVHRTQVAVGVGFRSRLMDNLDFGFAYEKAVAEPHGIFGDRFTADLIFRF
jgi:hypothetical protein